MNDGRYELNWADRSGVESTLMRHDSGEVLLEIRDQRCRESDPTSILWRVLDSEDYEGEVEWCESCGRHAVFGLGLCERCELDHEIEKGEPFGIHIPWRWPKRPILWSPRSPYDYELHGL